MQITRTSIITGITRTRELATRLPMDAEEREWYRTGITLDEMADDDHAIECVGLLDVAAQILGTA